MSALLNDLAPAPHTATVAAPPPVGPPPPAPDVPPTPMPTPLPIDVPSPTPVPEGDPPPDALPVTEPNHSPPIGDPSPGVFAVTRKADTVAIWSRAHVRRLRDVHRSAGWPSSDAMEIELLAAGLLERRCSPMGHESLRLSNAGIAVAAAGLANNRAALSAHEALVERVACEMTRAGRIAWRGLSLRSGLSPLEPGGKTRWCVAKPDVFSIRNTSVEAYAHPVVHEVKVSRADLLGDLRKADKRDAYLALGGECWYVLGQDARGRDIASADEIPEACGVLMADSQRFSVARPAVHRLTAKLSFSVWMALAKARPVARFDDPAQHLLGEPIKQMAVIPGL